MRFSIVPSTYVKKTVVYAMMAIAFLMCGTAESASAASNPQWGMFHNDAGHTGLSRYSTAGNIGSLQWTYALTNYADGSPVIGADGTIYIAGGSVYAITTSGATKWTFPLGNEFYSYSTVTPALDNAGNIYFGAYNGFFYSVDSAGKQIWALPMNHLIFDTDATISGNTIYVGDEEGALHALNPDSSTKWSFGLKSSIYSTPSIRGQTFAIPSLAGGLSLLRLDGSLIEQLLYPNLAMFEFAAPVARDGSVYEIRADGSLLKIKPFARMGKIQWELPIAPYDAYQDFWASPAIAADGTVYVNSQDGNLYSISSEGSINWALAVGGSFSSPAISADGTIYLGSNNQFYAINPDGSIKWTVLANGLIYSSPAIGANGWVYFAAENIAGFGGTLYALH